MPCQVLTSHSVGRIHYRSRQLIRGGLLVGCWWAACGLYAQALGKAFAPYSGPLTIRVARVNGAEGVWALIRTFRTSAVMRGPTWEEFQYV